MSEVALRALGTFGVGVLCVVLGIIALALFFGVMSRFDSAGASPEAVAVRGVLKKDTWVTVHMQGAETFARVRFLGFTNAGSAKGHLPYDLGGMVILEDESGRRVLVRAKAVRMIVIAPAEAGSAPALPPGEPGA